MNVGLRTEECAQGPDDVAWSERRSGHLVEQELKDMVIRAVDQDDLDITQKTCSRHASNPPPMMTTRLRGMGLNQEAQLLTKADRLNRRTEVSAVADCTACYRHREQDQ